MAGLADHMTHSRQVQQRHYNTSKKLANTVKAFLNIQNITKSGDQETQEPKTQKTKTREPETHGPETHGPETQESDTQEVPETQKPETHEAHSPEIRATDPSDEVVSQSSMGTSQGSYSIAFGPVCRKLSAKDIWSLTGGRQKVTASGAILEDDAGIGGEAEVSEGGEAVSTGHQATDSLPSLGTPPLQGQLEGGFIIPETDEATALPIRGRWPKYYENIVKETFSAYLRRGKTPSLAAIETILRSHPTAFNVLTKVFTFTAIRAKLFRLRKNAKGR